MSLSVDNDFGVATNFAHIAAAIDIAIYLGPIAEQHKGVGAHQCSVAASKNVTFYV